MTGSLNLVELAATRQVVVCCGAGGVGKTTSAAALALLAAQHGRRALVMTIDPARRLAQAMGLAALGNEPQTVAVDAPGRLAALMLDPKRTFDDLVAAYAPNGRVRDAIFANRYYQQLSSALGGSRELVAMERVLEVAGTGEFDLLVVDTPPAHHALDFLDAPQRLIDLLDGSFTQMLMRPYGLAARAQFDWFRQSSTMAMKFMERLSGVEVLADLSEFMLAFSSMFDGFKERSHRVMTLIREPTTAFLLVCVPEPVSLTQVEVFRRRLAAEGLDVGGVLVNREHQVSPVAGELSESDRARLEPLAPGLAQRVSDANRDLCVLAGAETAALAPLMASGVPVCRVGEFDHDVAGIDDLVAFAARLSGAGS